MKHRIGTGRNFPVASLRSRETYPLLMLMWGIMVSTLYAQGEVDSVSISGTYQIVLTQYELLAEYYPAGDDVISLFREAQIYAENKEYDLAVVYLEQAIDLLKKPGQSLKTDDYNSNDIADRHQFKLAALSGIDFSRQEFESAYFDEDSLMVEELNKVYSGLMAAYRYQLNENEYIDAQNTIRFDRENLRNDYRIFWQASPALDMQYAGYWNNGQNENTYSYWEQLLSVHYDLTATDLIRIRFSNIFDYKLYGRSQLRFTDYYRNRFNGRLEFNTPSTGRIHLAFLNELNQSLGIEDNDYTHRAIQIGFQDGGFRRMEYYLVADAAIRKYSFLYDTDLIRNTYRTLDIDGSCELAVAGNFRLGCQDNFIWKTYRQKSTMEPDYFWNLLRVLAKIDLPLDLNIGLGTEYEFKDHQSLPSGDYNVNEQNYHSSGLYLELNYFPMEGNYFSASVSYQKRRYPDSVTNDLIGLYSNRNLLSFMIIGSLNISRHLTMQVFATFDNDKDIDLDQQDNQSSIFTAEVVYNF